MKIFIDNITFKNKKQKNKLKGTNLKVRKHFYLNKICFKTMTSQQLINIKMIIFSVILKHLEYLNRLNIHFNNLEIHPFK